jgi:uncharacterized protein
VVEPLHGAPWVHPDLQVRASPVHGLGLFAGADVATGTVVTRLGGRLVPTAVLRALLDAAARGDRPYVDTLTVAPDVHLVLPVGTPSGRGNHSCDPNTWWTDAVTLVARRPVPAGAEVTNDYATSTDQEGFVMSCSCGSPQCRGRISGTDWRRADLRRRYGEHWIPALLARIRADG